MAWIKRNLFFVIGAVISVALLGFAAFYNFSGWKHNNEAREARLKAYKELQRLNSLPVHPGAGSVDNILAARQQRTNIQGFIRKTGKYFVSPQPIPAIAPGSSNLTSSQFTAALRETVSQLTREANNASVILPNDYKFTFTQQFRLLTFAGGLEDMAMQLGEIKILCTELFKAKINSLDSIQRTKVSPDDYSGAATDYLFDQSSVTNELAVVSPYQVVFRSFSPEIAQVLTAFANSPYGIIVENLQVVPAGAMATEAAPSATANPYGGPNVPRPRTPAEEDAIERGLYRPNVYTAPARPTGPVAVVDERPLQVIMTIKMVRLVLQP